MKSSIRFATAVLLFGLLPFPGNAQDGPVHLWGSLRDVPRTLSPAFVDYDRNGIDDLVGRNNPWLVWVDGWTGEVTKAIRPQGDLLIFAHSHLSIPDQDGDSLREVLVVAGGYFAEGKDWPRVVHGIPGSHPGGFLTDSLLYTTEVGEMRLAAATATVGILEDSPQSRVTLLDLKTGSIAAVLQASSRDYDFGRTAAAIDDVNGDGIEDIVVGSSRKRNIQERLSYMAFVIDGGTRSAEPVTIDLGAPGPPVLAVLEGFRTSTGDNSTASLGDPLPANGARETLVVSSNGSAGGFVAHLVRVMEGGSLEASRVALILATPGSEMGDVVRVEDLDLDGADDVAVTELSDVEGSRVGLVRILSGAGLLAGPSEPPLIAEIRSPESLHDLHDLNGDGLQDLLAGMGDPDQRFDILSLVPPGSSLSDCNANGVPDVSDLVRREFALSEGVPHAAGRTAVGTMNAVDLDADGDQDLVATTDPTHVTLLFNTGAGVFDSPSDIPLPALPNDLITADLDGDGRLDVSVVSSLRFIGPGVVFEPARNVFILLQGEPGFEDPPVSLPLEESSSNLASADIDDDGDVDLLASVERQDLIGGNLVLNQGVVVLRNGGSGEFETGPRYKAENGPLAAADLNGDGHVDIAVTGRHVLRNQGDGSFDVLPLLGWDASARVRAVDLDRDADIDLFLAGRDGLLLARNPGDGAFEQSFQEEADVPWATSMDAADMDGDGHMDAVVSVEDVEEGLRVYHTTKGGAWGEVSRYVTLPDPGALVIADFDGDGSNDVSLSHGGVGEIRVHFNRSIPPRWRDCNGNAVPDECDVSSGGVADENENLVPDVCEMAPFRRGDPNDDGVMNIGDPVFLLRLLFLSTALPGCLEAADSNDDDRYDLSDAVHMLRFLFLGEPPPPPPSPAECGPDTGAPARTLGCELYTSCF